ncbi:MAG: hypothetical protein A2583_12655 [Bdellovibrionales bacterium RIFOXYD1_FULL_53_11]|nr:MAG: hypothetical protein A2583_12655 [Bdellovibrionales bacterium RIFOXYD1_FULL_53_11]
MVTCACFVLAVAAATAASALAEPPSPGNCDKYCDWALDLGKKHFSKENAAQSEQWCADHGKPVSESTAQTTKLPAEQAAAVSKTCGGLLVFPGEDCTTVKERFIACKLRGGQVSTYCGEYVGQTGPIVGDTVIMALDAAAAIACWAACGGVKHAEAACSWIGLGAGVAEMAYAVYQVAKSKEASQISGILTGAVGTGMSIYTLAKTKGGKESSGSKTMSCLSAITFTASTALRAVNLANYAKARKSACKNVKELGSDAATVESFQAMQATNSLPSAGGGGSGGGAQTGLVSSELKPGDAKGEGISDAMLAKAFAATEGQWMQGSGIEPLLAEQLKKMDFNALLERTKSGENAGSLLASLAGDQPFAGQMSELAQFVQDNADEIGKLAPGFGSSAVYSPASGGTTASAPKDNTMDNIQGMMNGLLQGMQPGQKEEGGSGASSVKFGGTANAGNPDIWHSGTKASIFQIVSDRIVNARDRIEKLDWSLPLNKHYASQAAPVPGAPGATPPPGAKK